MNIDANIDELIASIPVRLFDTDEATVLMNEDGEVIATFALGDQRAEAAFLSHLSGDQLEALVIDAEITAEFAAERASERCLSYGPGIY